VAPGEPELYFCEDLRGYGWCFRKQGYLNVGFGRLDCQALPRATAEFVAFLTARRKMPASASWRWRGHAYRVYQSHGRRVTAPGVVLVGDAAGLACPKSGEGIRPAIESGLLAASVLLEARGDYTEERLDPYAERLRARFGSRSAFGELARVVPAALATAIAGWCLDSSWFVRHVVLNRWFLHAGTPALAGS
jgi:flavin-dependent dehydrogenase